MNALAAAGSGHLLHTEPRRLEHRPDRLRAAPCRAVWRSRHGLFLLPPLVAARAQDTFAIPFPLPTPLPTGSRAAPLAVPLTLCTPPNSVCPLRLLSSAISFSGSCGAGVIRTCRSTPHRPFGEKAGNELPQRPRAPDKPVATRPLAGHASLHSRYRRKDLLQKLHF